MVRASAQEYQRTFFCKKGLLLNNTMTSVLNSFWLGIKVPLRKAVYWLQYNLLYGKAIEASLLLPDGSSSGDL